MPLTLRQLEIFEGVAKSEHVTKASEKLLLSQSAVSMAIAELEKFAGAKLFERRGRRLLLNDRGRQILPEVHEVLKRVGTIEQFLNESIDEPIGVLNVGASTTIGNYLLPLIVGEFTRQFPRAKALLYVGNTQQIEIAVENGEYDLGLIEGPSHNSSLISAPWRNDELVVIAGKEHPWTHEKKASINMMETASWIMREKGSGTREIFETAMDAKGIKYSIAMELGHTEAIKKAVEAGLGVGCLSRMAVKRELENGWLIEIDSQLALKRMLIILTRDSGYRTTLMSAFLTLLGKTNKSISAPDPTWVRG
jgi:DNA-binding transcriptional LysR family regulator